jgi:hypothetical protein
MSNVLAPSPVAKFFDNNGAPLALGLLFTYIAGTTTKLVTHTGASGGDNANPIILNARGEANVWLPPNVAFKFTLAPPGDTDPPSNPIYSVDNIVAEQPTTLYGGVDTGSANAYSLTFTANFAALTDGMSINWLPSHANTAASVITVNGLGPYSIVNPDGSALGNGALAANVLATIVWQTTQWVLQNPNVALLSFTPAWTGFSVAPTGDMDYQIVGRVATLQWRGTTGTSNATSMTIGNLPNNLRPALSSITRLGVTVVIDSGAAALGAFLFSGGSTLEFQKGTAPPSSSGFTNSGTKGLDKGLTLSYMLS